MTEQDIRKTIIDFWNDHFKSGQAITINQSDITLDTPLDECLRILGDACESVLDVACGNGLCLIETMLIGGKIKYGLGFDSSVNAITTANQMVARSNIENLHFDVGDEHYFDGLSNQHFDGIICSNFLDVIPDVISQTVIHQIKRVLKPGGLLLLKFNFYLSEALIARLHMEQVAPDAYSINHVFRANNKTTEKWLSYFPDYEIIQITGFQRAPGLPEDRLMLIKKPSIPYVTRNE